MIEQAIQKAANTNRQELLQLKSSQPNRSNNIIPFILTFNPGNPPVSKILQNNTKILSDSHDLQHILQRRFVLVQKRCTNLRQILVQTDINPKLIPRGTGPCNGPCVICKYMQKTTKFTSHHTNETFTINGHFNCQTKSAIYLINCKKWGIQYIGQTGNTINERIRGHMGDIRAGNDAKPVSRHFTANQHTLNDVSVIVICMTTRNVNIRLRTEEVWIATVHTREPEGLNLIQ